MSEPGQLKPHRLIHFTPLRYPGGKGKLTAYIKALMKRNRLVDGEYVEPYAGGAAIALELLFHEYVSCIHINDVSRPIYAFWKSVLDHTDELSKRIIDTRLTVTSWDKQKKVLEHADDHDGLALGFATFFLNRTNRSGILNGGIIGGRDQSGPWKIDARYNATELVQRIKAIASMGHRIKLTRQDALKFLKAGSTKWPEKTLVYIDPPYYVKGRDLYYDFYEPEDHAKVATLITGSLTRQKWIVSYDNVPEIRDLYRGAPHIVYDIGYSAATSSKQGSEVMFFGPKLVAPPLVGSITLTEDHTRQTRSA